MCNNDRHVLRHPAAQLALIVGLTALVWLFPINRSLGQPPQDHLDQVSRLHWKLGTLARDQLDDPILAAQHFYRAAEAADLRGNASRSSYKP